MKSNNEKAVNNYLLDLRDTNKTLSYYVDWEKVKNNSEEYKLDLVQLNIFTKCKDYDDLKRYVKQIFDVNRQSCFRVLEILIAKRCSDKKYFDEKTFEIKEYSFDNVDNVFYFMKETNLLDLFKSVNSLEDYVFGVEVGLDTNGRKNRSGKIMENSISNILKKLDIKFSEQKYLKDLDSNLFNSETKRADFVFEINGIIYIIESSFYNSSGSKISETLKSYINLREKLEKNYKMIWVADGEGMKTIKNLLLDKWNNISILNLKQFEKMLQNLII